MKSPYIYVYNNIHNMEKEKLQLTSVKVHDNLFDEFKVFCVRTKFSLQKLVDRSMYLYITDDEFRKKIHNTINISVSGSIK